MSDRDLKREFDTLIKDACTPVFKRLGFKKEGLNFFRETEELIQTFNFQKSPFNTNELSFTGNVGFIEPETHLKLYQIESLPKFPKCTDSIVQFRLGELTHGGDYWYRLTPTSNTSDLIEKVRKDLQVVECMFESHKTLLSIEEYFSDRTKVNPFWGEAGQFALYKRIGKDKEARRILLSVYQQAQKPKSWVTIQERIKGTWKEKKSAPQVNHFWVERIEQVVKIYNEPLS